MGFVLSGRFRCISGDATKSAATLQCQLTKTHVGTFTNSVEYRCEVECGLAATRRGDGGGRSRGEGFLSAFIRALLLLKDGRDPSAAAAALRASAVAAACETEATAISLKGLYARGALELRRQWPAAEAAAAVSTAADAVAAVVVRSSGHRESPSISAASAAATSPTAYPPSVSSSGGFANGTFATRRDYGLFLSGLFAAGGGDGSKRISFSRPLPLHPSWLVYPNPNPIFRLLFLTLHEPHLSSAYNFRPFTNHTSRRSQQQRQPDHTNANAPTPPFPTRERSDRRRPQSCTRSDGPLLRRLRSHVDAGRYEGTQR